MKYSTIQFLLALSVITASACGSDSNPANDNPCDDVDCGAFGRCATLDGRAVCVCEPGHAGNQCEIPPVCAPNPCTSGHRTVCAELSGQPICLCASGYHDDGVGGCAPVAAEPCANDPCTNTNRNVCAIITGVEVCLCNPGYIDNGSDCIAEPDGPCDPNPCTTANRTICQAVGTTAVCACDADYHDELGSCVANDPCTPNPCVEANRHVCTADGSVTACDCDGGFHDLGGACVADDPCQPNPCADLNQTVCFDDAGVPRCDCDSGFHDDDGTCVADDPCTPNPCTDLHRGVCVENGSSTRCDCDPEYVEDPDSGDCIVDQEPVCQDSHTTGDVYEPDECPSLATALVVGAAQDHSIDATVDNDWLSLSAQEGHIYRFTATESDVDLYVYLYDTDGITVLRSQDTATFTYELPTTDTYYYRVRAYSSSATGNYTVTVSDEGLDDHGDDAASATSLTVDVTTDGSIETAGDDDWFSLAGEAGHIYRFTATENQRDLYVYLYHADGTTVLRAQDTAAFTFELPTTGTYYYRVRASSSSATGTYTVTVTDEGLDDHGDDAASATPLTIDVTTDGSIETAGDDDWFSLAGEAGHIYRFAATETQRDLYIYLYHTDGTTVLRSQDTATFTFELPTTDTYYYRVRASSSSATGNYTVTVSDDGMDDHGDDAASATSLSIDVTTNGSIETAGDDDWFSLSGEAGHIYRFTATENQRDLYVYLFDVDGTTVLRSQDTATFTYELPTTDTYFYRVRAYSSSATGSYTVTVSDEGLDDHGDDAASATSLTIDGAADDGSIETAGDDDWFSLSGEAGHIYRFTATESQRDLYVYLYHVDGTTVLRAQDTATFTYELPTTDTYFYRVRAYSSSATGNYTVTVSDEGLDDHGDGTTTATPIGITGETVDGRIETAGDTDWFVFSASGGVTYQITVTGISPSSTVFAADGITVVASSSSSTFACSVGALGTHYLRVRHSSSAGTGAYTVAIHD